jgi:hypothetical protein
MAANSESETKKVEKVEKENGDDVIAPELLDLSKNIPK